MAIIFWSICLWLLQARQWLCRRSFSCWGSSKDSSLDCQLRQSSSSCWCQIEFHKWWKTSSAIVIRHRVKHCWFSSRCNVSIHAWFRQLCCPQFWWQTIWQSFEDPTDTFLASQHLLAFTLYSSVSEYDHSTGKFRLLMQGDGNLVLYAIGTLLLPEYSY